MYLSRRCGAQSGVGAQPWALTCRQRLLQCSQARDRFRTRPSQLSTRGEDHAPSSSWKTPRRWGQQEATACFPGQRARTGGSQRVPPEPESPWALSSGDRPHAGRSLQLTSGDCVQTKLGLCISATSALDLILRFNALTLTSVLGRRKGRCSTRPWGRGRWEQPGGGGCTSASSLGGTRLGVSQAGAPSRPASAVLLPWACSPGCGSGGCVTSGAPLNRTSARLDFNDVAA